MRSDHRKKKSDTKSLKCEADTDVKSLKLGNFEIILSNENFFTIVETLLSEIKGKEEKEKEELNSTDGIVDTVKPVAEKIIKTFKKDINSPDLSEGEKTVLKTVSKFVSVLTNNKLKKAAKIKDLLKQPKVALETWQEQNQSAGKIISNEQNNFKLIETYWKKKFFIEK